MSRNLGLQLAQRCRAAARTRFPQLGGRLWSERLPQQSRNYAQAAKAPLKTATALPDGTVTAGSTRVLFERAPGWYIRWMWALIGLDLIWWYVTEILVVVVASFIEAATLQWKCV